MRVKLIKKIKPKILKRCQVLTHSSKWWSPAVTLVSEQRSERRMGPRKRNLVHLCILCTTVNCNPGTTPSTDAQQAWHGGEWDERAATLQLLSAISDLGKMGFPFCYLIVRPHFPGGSLGCWPDSLVFVSVVRLRRFWQWIFSHIFKNVERMQSGLNLPDDSVCVSFTNFQSGNSFSLFISSWEWKAKREESLM